MCTKASSPQIGKQHFGHWGAYSKAVVEEELRAVSCKCLYAGDTFSLPFGVREEPMSSGYVAQPQISAHVG